MNREFRKSYNYKSDARKRTLENVVKHREKNIKCSIWVRAIKLDMMRLRWVTGKFDDEGDITSVALVEYSIPRM